MIRGIKLASIPVRDQEVALQFYTEKLGFKVLTDQQSATSGAGSNSESPEQNPNWLCSLPKDTRIESEVFSR